MKLELVLSLAIEPALALLPARMASTEARVMLLSIGLQESRFSARRQAGNGPARSYWQFERGGGVQGIVNHPSSKGHLARLCEVMDVAVDSHDIWRAIEFNDVLAAACARLLLWTEPSALPAVDDAGRAWALYLRAWRPGKPHPRTWAGHHRAAREVLGIGVAS